MSSLCCALASERPGHVGERSTVRMRGSAQLSVRVQGRSSTGGSVGRDLGRYNTGVANLHAKETPNVNASAADTTTTDVRTSHAA